MMDIGTWQDMSRKENLVNTFIKMVDTCQSHLGKDIKKLITEYDNLKTEPWGSNSLLDLFRVTYIEGKYSHPISDNVYYYLIGKPNEIVPRRDLEKSPKSR